MILADGEDTGGCLGLVRDVVPAGHRGPRLHLHPRFDEGFYVLDGELIFQLGDAVITVCAGELALARRGVAHTFANRTDRDAQVLMFVTPSGFERYFADGAARATPRDEETIVVGERMDDAPPAFA